MRPWILLLLMLALGLVAFGAVAAVDHNRALRIDRTLQAMEQQRAQRVRALDTIKSLPYRLDAGEFTAQEALAQQTRLEEDVVRFERRLAELQDRLDRRPRPIIFFRR